VTSKTLGDRLRDAGFWLSLGLATVPLSWPGTARAESNPAAAAAAPLQPPAEEPAAALDAEQALARAKQRYAEGVAAYDRKLYKDAIDLFLEADRLAPSANLSFNMARAYEKLRDTEHTLARYRDYLRRAPDAPDRTRVERFVAELAERLRKKGVQQVTILSNPTQATVIIDDAPLGVTPWTGQLVPGQHRLSLERRGFLGASQLFELPPGAPLDVVVELVPAPEREELLPATAGAPALAPPTAAVAPPLAAPTVALPPPGAAPAATALPRERSASVGPWITLGAGATSLGIAVGFELARRSAEQRARKDVEQLDYQRDLETMQRHQLTARILAVTGSVVLLGGGTWLALDLSGGSARELQLSGIGCDTGGCSVSVRRVF
jgi:tetratricopeptide (TPR) repeat protein